MRLEQPAFGGKTVYTFNQFCPIPPDQDAPIWRYMSFAKFANLLVTESLFFCRADKFDDPHEGAIPRVNREDLLVRGTEDSDGGDQARSLREGYSRHNPNAPRFMCVISWHANESESQAMWEQYSGGTDGVAIRSTFRRLCDAFKGTQEHVYAGCVSYIDYEIDEIRPCNIFSPFMTKGREFRSEQEVRGLVERIPYTATGVDLNASVVEAGVLIRCDLSALIKAVVLSPAADSWLRDTVEGLERWAGLNAPVVESSLAKAPQF